MNDQERLFEILNKYHNEGPTHVYYFTPSESDVISKYLINNGVLVPPVRVGQSVWTPKPFKDGIVREGHITIIEYDEKGLFGFWVSFEGIPTSVEFIVDDIDSTVFLSKEASENNTYPKDDNKCILTNDEREDKTMDNRKYQVLSGSRVIADNMDLSSAMLMAEAMFHKYYEDAGLSITIKAMDTAKIQNDK